MTSWFRFLEGIGLILSKWTDDLTIPQQTAIVAAWGNWTPGDVISCVEDPHSPQREKLADIMHELFWTNQRPIRTRVWESNWTPPSVNPDEIPIFKSMMSN